MWPFLQDKDHLLTEGVATASPEAGFSRAKIDWPFSVGFGSSRKAGIFFACKGEGVCGGLHMHIVGSVTFVFLSALLFLSTALEFLFLSSSPHWPFNCTEISSR